jgi:hypothetical protein
MGENGLYAECVRYCSMRVRRLLLLVGIALACASGCQSGWVTNVQQSSDGKVIAFTDLRYGQLYVADSRGVRSLRNAINYVLSPDGNWLVTSVKPDSLWDRGEWFEDGDLLLLYDVKNDRIYSTPIPSTGRLNPARSATEVRLSATQPSIGFAGDGLPRIGVSIICFGPGSQLTYGPVSGFYWTWKPEDKSGVVWTKTPEASPAAAIPPSGITVPFDSYTQTIDKPDCIVAIPCDGWNAPTTVWIRPDGSTLELTRKNDSPGWCAVGVLLETVTLPFAVAVDLVFAVTSPDLAGEATRGSLFGAKLSFASAFESLRVDEEAVRQSLEQLRQRIAERRAAASSQPTTAPNK